MPSKEVADATGEAPSLEARAAALRQIVGTKTDREQAAEELARVEAQIAAQDAADMKDAAAARLLGIVRALGGLTTNLEQDDVRLLAAATAYKTAMQTLGARFLKCSLLKHEAQALAEAFGLAMPELPPITPPGLRPAVGEAARTVVAAPVVDNGYIADQRAYDAETRAFGARTYQELDGTPGHALLLQRATGMQPVTA